MPPPSDRSPDINPYAPSAIPQPIVTLADRGIGVWRDGNEIVIHPRAELPRYCIVTGEPARFGYYLRIAWSRPFDLTPRSLGLYVPLSAAVHKLCRRRRWQAIGSFLGAAALAALALVRYDMAGGGGIALSLGLFLVVGLGAFYFYVQYSQFLYFSALNGDYLRLKGADVRFLRRLPEWES
jgi:hypothetical protein